MDTDLPAAMSIRKLSNKNRKLPAGLFLFLLLFLHHAYLFSQTRPFRGIIRDEQTMKPVPDVNVKIYGTSSGTSTDKDGRFEVSPAKVPSALVFSCLGYENEYYRINEIPDLPVEFLLRPKSYPLKEVNVTSGGYTFIFTDRDYSVLDYEIAGGNVFLLIFRTFLKQSELILLDPNRDTLAVSGLPEGPPSGLFRDFLSNIHYISKTGYAFQCYYNRGIGNIDFIHRTSTDSLDHFVRPFLFRISGRLYFQEKIADGFGTTVGYYEKGKGKTCIRQYINRDKISEFQDDQVFYQKWNALMGQEELSAAILSGKMREEYTDPEFDFSAGDSSGSFFEKNEARAHAFEYYNMTYPVIKTGDSTITFFNFGNDVIEYLDPDGKMIRAVPISFHRGHTSSADTAAFVRLADAGWRWGNRILPDELNHEFYTVFLKAGMVRINRIDPGTGSLKRGTVLPLPFPEKIEIYGSEAYFLSKGADGNWKLVKCKL